MATGWQIARARRWQQLSKLRVVRIFRIPGVASFALLVPLALILVHSGRRWIAVARLSPALSLAAAAILALGLLFITERRRKRLAAWQTAGTALWFSRAVLLLLLVAAAWPQPELLLAVGLMNCVVLAILGIVAKFPCSMCRAWRVRRWPRRLACILSGGQFADREHLPLAIVQAALMGRTSAALSVLACAVLAIGAWQLAVKRASDARNAIDQRRRRRRDRRRHRTFLRLHRRARLAARSRSGGVDPARLCAWPDRHWHSNPSSGKSRDDPSIAR